MNRDAPANPDPNERDAAHDSREFEVELALRRLTLRDPSPQLDARVARVIGSVQPYQRPRPLVLAAAAIIAVAVGTVPLVLQRSERRSHHPLAKVQELKPTHVQRAAGPLRVEQQVARVSDDGVIGTANGVPVQLLRYRAVRQIWYFDPHTGKKLQVTVPRDQAFLVPVRTF